MNEIFISAEAYHPAGDLICEIINDIKEIISDIDVTEYTKDIDSIGIIINCFDKHLLEAGFGKPRKYISYKNRFADIRLNIPYEEFMEGDREKRYKMIKQNIFDSIQVIDERLNKKKGCSFDGEKMISDIEERLERSELFEF